MLTAAVYLDLLDTKIPRAIEYAKTEDYEKVNAAVQCWHLQDMICKVANGITLPLEKLVPKSTPLSNLMVKGCFFALFFLFCSSAPDIEFGKPVTRRPLFSSRKNNQQSHGCGQKSPHSVKIQLNLP